MRIRHSKSSVLLIGYTRIGYIDHGIIRYRKMTDDDNLPRELPHYGYWAPIEKMAKEIGLPGYRMEHAESLLRACDGKPAAFLKEELARRKIRSDQSRRNRKENAAEWAKLNQRFNNFVIGVDDIDLYETGFTVYVLLNSRWTFEQQCQWVRKNRAALVRYVQEEMPRTTKLSKKKRQLALETLPFCVLDETVLSRQNLLLLKYEVKESIREALDTEQET